MTETAQERGGGGERRREGVTEHYFSRAARTKGSFVLSAERVKWSQGLGSV